MKQFNLSEWLQDKSRKVVTRDGRAVRILCTDAKAKDGCCIIAAIETDGEEEGYQFFKDGTAYSSKSSIEDCADLFFADEEEPKKALMMNKEEALQQYEYEKQLFEQWGGTSIITFKEWLEIKSIVLADEEEELTEFEKAVKQVMWTAYNYDDCSNGKDVDDISNVKATSKTLLDLARKELKPEFDKEMDKMLAETDKVVYQKGREDALKDLPKWIPNKFEKRNWETCKAYLNTPRYLVHDDWMISVEDLESLPKEE